MLRIPVAAATPELRRRAAAVCFLGVAADVMVFRARPLTATATVVFFAILGGIGEVVGVVRKTLEVTRWYGASGRGREEEWWV